MTNQKSGDMLCTAYQLTSHHRATRNPVFHASSCHWYHLLVSLLTKSRVKKLICAGTNPPTTRSLRFSWSLVSTVSMFTNSANKKPACAGVGKT